MELEVITTFTTDTPDANFTTATEEDFDDYDFIESFLLRRFIVYGILLTVIGLFGLVGNVISIVILYRLNIRSSINVCLLGLTTFDLLVIIAAVSIYGLFEIGRYTNCMLLYVHGLAKVMHIVFPFGLIARTGSNYMTVILTVERFVAVCLPFRFRSLVTYGRARILVVVATAFSVLYNLPRFWEHFSEERNVNGTIIYEIKASALRDNYLYKHVYNTWMFLTVQYLIPFFSLLILNFRIYLEVRAANQGMERLSRPQRKEIRLVLMLLAVVIVFFLCNTFPCIINIVEIAGINVDALIIEVSNLLVTTNSSVNFIIYCTFSQRFRKDFLKMFNYCCPGQGQEVMSTSSNLRSTEVVMLSLRGDPRNKNGNFQYQNNDDQKSL